VHVAARLAFDVSGLAVLHRVHHRAVAVGGVIAVLWCQGRVRLAGL
jgi:hypothetical protein